MLSFAMLFGCGDSPDTVRLEVYSWWEEESERQAFEAVIEIHERNHEGVEVDNLGDATADEIRQDLATSILAGAPPATFQANLGADMLRWTMVETLDPNVEATDENVQRSRWIRELSGLFGRTNLETERQDGLLEGLAVPGTTVPYAVPINIHRLNVLYYNVEALAEVERRLAERGDAGSLLDLATLCAPETDFEGTGLRIAIGLADPPWPLVLLTFENVLPALHGWEFYDALFTGERWKSEGNASQKVRSALECVQHLSRWFVRDSGMGWAEAVAEVRDPLSPATFTVMGDWANGLLLDDPDELVVKGVPFPVLESVPPGFVFTSDTFPLPISAAHPSEAEALLETIASPSAQLAFSAQKGSIPARRDVSLESLPPSRTRTRDDYETLTRVMATSGYFPPYYPIVDLWNALGAMTEMGAGEAEVDEALRVFTETEPLLLRWHERLERGAADPYEP